MEVPPSHATADTPISHIFLSYARDDKDTVEKIHGFLTEAGHDVFMDVHNLLGGEDWKKTIFEEIESRDIFIFCISANSLTRRGMIRKELKRALEVLEGMLPDDIYLIPLRLENVLYPKEIEHLHALDWFTEEGKAKLKETIEEAMKRRSE